MSDTKSRQARPRSVWDYASLALDLGMITLAISNLAWIIFDSIWLIPELRAIMGLVIPDSWLSSYQVVNENFFKIDLIFVSIFLTEFSARWAYAVWHKRYRHWFAFPVLHWYDILGCIPVAGFRWLRILRVFAILYRLQRLGLIDYTQWSAYQFGKGIYDVVMEEISDRVVLRVLDGVQKEVSASHDIEKQIIDQVLGPRQDLITEALRDRVIHIGQSTYSRSREDLHHFISQTVQQAIHENREIKALDRIPVIGGTASRVLDYAITDIVCKVMDQFAGRLDSPEFERLFSDIATALFDSFATTIKQPGANDQLSAAINDILDVVKAQVAERRWLHPESQDSERASGEPAPVLSAS